ncbi:membrane protease YdiL (CAAX protease family) [Lipingzhangella halophila]|uniref:Membrane protease YdiL (CAAX protease family) n=1 Tax=Lipingzhangella halophila TaxID=1783352 RepID=A0A7W7RCT0_9ACTN|nr:CPBP family intramembrane glutamic endopeptidase [Lipingzhangella halophila]MBB4929480.1 membrane protease YdiL (CAAX protease family) [Lipingzhangella halophila]
MTTTFRWVLWASLAAFALALAAALIADPALLVRATWHGADPLWTVWLPTAAGIALSWVIVTRRQRQELANRVRTALEDHPIGAETCWLLLFLLCFVAGAVVLSRLLDAAFPPQAYVTAVPVVRVLFLFVLPILFIDRAGITRVGASAPLPALALRVNEPWRWLGLLPVAVCVGLVAVGVRDAHMPAPGAFALATLVTVVAISVPEEVFFRGMLQARLELLAGRWSGIAATSLLFVLVHVLMDPYNEIVDLAPTGSPHLLGAAVLTYGPLGVLLGYVWSQYGSIWLVILLRGAMLTLVVAPSVRIMD